MELLGDGASPELPATDGVFPIASVRLEFVSAMVIESVELTGTAKVKVTTHAEAAVVAIG
jgi:hypothetical protein